ncbi:MAG: rhodanese-like domain-containing protein [Elusimicrobiota bacterium]|nr:MAG: rhodanese-like domain-containing protein [Elusimicrobiota bacterium]
MTVSEYAAFRREKTPHLLLDVRQPEEYETARLEGAVLIPLGELPGRLAELPKDRPLVVMCHHGMRSAHAVHHLRQAGFDAVNLTGGIDAWSREIDGKVPLY